MNPVIIDVRESDEFECQHIRHSIHVPFSSFWRLAPPLLRSLSGRKILLICQSGKRARLAASEANQLQANCEIEVYPGGIEAWIQQGKAVETFNRPRLPIMRQVQLIAGLLILLGVLLSLFLNPTFIFVSAFVGVGLTVAGATGFCGMALLLNRMPWNRNRKQTTTCNA